MVSGSFLYGSALPVPLGCQQHEAPHSIAWAMPQLKHSGSILKKCQALIANYSILLQGDIES